MGGVVVTALRQDRRDRGEYIDLSQVRSSLRVFQHRRTGEVIVTVTGHEPMGDGNFKFAGGSKVDTSADWEELDIATKHQDSYFDMLQRRPELSKKFNGEGSENTPKAGEGKDEDDVKGVSGYARMVGDDHGDLDTEGNTSGEGYRTIDDHDKNWNEMRASLLDADLAVSNVAKSVQNDLSHRNPAIQKLHIALSHHNHKTMHSYITDAIARFEEATSVNQRMGSLARKILYFDGKNGEVDRIYQYQQQCMSLVRDLEAAKTTDEVRMKSSEDEDENNSARSIWGGLVLERRELEKYQYMGRELLDHANAKKHLIESYRESLLHYADIEFTDTIYHGNFSSTYLARRTHTKTGCFYAVKIMKTANIKAKGLHWQACLEKVVMDRCSSFPDFFPLMMGGFKTRETLMLVSEFVPGGTLGRYLDIAEQHTGLPTGLDIRIVMKEICSAVACLHNYHVAHNQVTPDNILITHNGHVKLCDFSCITATDPDRKIMGDTVLDCRDDALSRLEKSGGWLSSLSEPRTKTNSSGGSSGGRFRGERWSSSFSMDSQGSLNSDQANYYSQDDFSEENRPENIDHRAFKGLNTDKERMNYFAPEVLSEKMLGNRSDHWSCGVILFRMLFGELPFGQRGEREERIRERVIALELANPNVLSGYRGPPAALDMARALLRHRGSRLGALGEDEVLNHPFIAKVNLHDVLKHRGPVYTEPKFDDPLGCIETAGDGDDERDVHEVGLHISLAVQDRDRDDIIHGFPVYPTL